MKRARGHVRLGWMPFLHKNKKKLIKDIIFLKAYKYTEIHYLQSKFPSVTVTVWVL